MRKALISILLSLACIVALAPSLPAFSAGKEPPAATSQAQEGAEESSSAQEVGRMIGALLKRATHVLKEVLQGISEGFKSTSEETEGAGENICSPEDARKGKCKPQSAGSEPGTPDKEPAQWLVFLTALFKALF